MTTTNNKFHRSMCHIRAFSSVVICLLYVAYIPFRQSRLDECVIHYSCTNQPGRTTLSPCYEYVPQPQHEPKYSTNEDTILQVLNEATKINRAINSPEIPNRQSPWACRCTCHRQWSHVPPAHRPQSEPGAPPGSCCSPPDPRRRSTRHA